LVESIIGEWRLKCEQIKRLVPLGAQKEATIGEIAYLKNISLTNHAMA